MRRFLAGALWATLAGCGPPPPPPPLPPFLLLVDKHDAALHIQWTAQETMFDATEGERRFNGGAWELRFSHGPSWVDFHDYTATQDGLYDYRLRCVKSGARSEYSTVKGRNPVR